MVFGGGIGRFARGKAAGSGEDAVSNQQPEEENDNNNKEQGGLPLASTGDDNAMWMQFDHQPVAPEFEGFGGEIGTDFSYNDGGFNFDDMMESAATTDTILLENDGHGSNTLNKITSTSTAGGGPIKANGMGIFSSRPKPSGDSSTSIPEAKDASSAVHKNDDSASSGRLLAATSASTTKPSNPPSGISLFGEARPTVSSISQLPTMLKSSAPNSQQPGSISQEDQQRSAAAIACSNPPMPPQQRTTTTNNNNVHQQNQISNVSSNNERVLAGFSGNSNSTRILPVGPSAGGTAKKSVTPFPSNNAVLPPQPSTTPAASLLNQQHRHAGGNNNNNPIVPNPLSQQGSTLLFPEKQMDAPPRLPDAGTTNLLENRNNGVSSAHHFQTPAAPARSRNQEGQSTTMFATPSTGPAAVTPSQDTPPVLFHKTPTSQAHPATGGAKARSQLVTPTMLDSSSFITATSTAPNGSFQESFSSTSEESSRHQHDHQGSFGGADMPPFDDLHAKFLSDTRDLEDLQNENASQLLDMDVLLSTALSASLKDQADFMDLLQQLQKEVNLADITILKYQML